MSVDRRVLTFLRNNPGSTPREIADALGLSINTVRVAIARLREAGFIMRSSRGGYVAKVVAPSSLLEEGHQWDRGAEISGTDTLSELREEIASLAKDVNYIKKRLERMETEINIIKKALQSSLKQSRADLCRTAREEDKLLAELRSRMVIPINEAKQLTSKPLETYVVKRDLVLVSKYTVLRSFYEEFKKKFPIKLNEVKRLSAAEKGLLDAMIKDGMVYLHGGREYRLIE
ncbi:MAG: hypothetical protein B6U73_00620 [Desulfurococcales archaeon ex4484_204]|nr:MAG: hypothetical protein B6U73_00620 [Desulfurococcales archaeon ex4484_204]